MHASEFQFCFLQHYQRAFPKWGLRGILLTAFEDDEQLGSA